ncbi:hypothetical protein ACIQAD_26565 [Streptomyces sp. NPDC088551]|uniref:hypothetical protein n=1 Tax=Streptomyces sp. NPDC088551 TaxID=3365863 RepID=UPI00380EB206
MATVMAPSSSVSRHARPVGMPSASGVTGKLLRVALWGGLGAPCSHELARASDRLEIETKTNSSAGIEVYASYDYIQLTRESGRLADKVTFHRKDDGYIIEHGTGHWDGHRYWQSYENPSWEGIRLNTRDNATVYKAVPTDRGFMLRRASAYDNSYALAYSNKGGKLWIYEGTGLVGLRSTAYFRTQK